MKKKILIIMLSLFMFVLSACDNAPKEKLDKNKKTVTVTSSFLYDMVKQLDNDHVNIRMIIPPGEDPHVYIAKPQDLDKILSADLVLYHGLHFEGKMSDVLEKKGYPVAGNFPKNLVGRMDEDGESVIDPHFWFSIDLYKRAVENVSKKLIELVPEDKNYIEKNTVNYLKELDDLKGENEKLLAEIPKGSRYLITPHDAFNYFSREYNMPVLAPQGVSTDSEVANKDIQKTVDFIIKHKVKAIFAESTTDPARMDKLKEACKAKGFNITVVKGNGNELFSDSLAPEGEKGDTYISMYKHNIKLIVDNLK